MFSPRPFFFLNLRLTFNRFILKTASVKGNIFNLYLEMLKRRKIISSEEIFNILFSISQRERISKYSLAIESLDTLKISIVTLI